MSENTTTPQEPQEVITPAEGTAPAASAETNTDPTAELLVKLDEVSTTLESKASSLEKAEKLIIEQKRKLKELGQEDPEEAIVPDLEAIVDRKVREQIATLAPVVREDPELAKARTTITELTESLKAKTTVANSGAGNNQDPYVPEVEVHLTAGDRQLLERRASAEGISLKEYIRKHNITT